MAVKATFFFSQALAIRKRCAGCSWRCNPPRPAIGPALGLAFVWLVGRPDAAEAVALAGLLAPALLALLAMTRICRSAVLEQAGLAVFAVLIGYLAILTGGVVSPLVVWFALVPAEAALTGGRSAVVRAGRGSRRGASGRGRYRSLWRLAAVASHRAAVGSLCRVGAGGAGAGGAGGGCIAGPPARRRQGGGCGYGDVSLPGRQCDGPDHLPCFGWTHPFRQPRPP